MAYITIEKTKSHLIERMKGRFNHSDKEAIDNINRIKEILETQSPEDWRFTTSPIAKFLVWDEKTGLRIVGRTYRDIGDKLAEKMKNPLLFQNKKKAKYILYSLQKEYLELIKRPDLKIIHELKTVFSRGQEITEFKHSYRSARIFLPHIIPIDAKRIATRPNAIINKNQKLVSRQNEFLNIGNSKEEFLLFEKLTSQGIDKSIAYIYIHDRNGNIKFKESFKRASNPLYLISSTLLPHFRTVSYWSLPTYVDAEYLDIKYKKEQFPSKITSEEALFLVRMDMIYAKIRNQLKLPYLEKEVLKRLIG